MTRPFRHLQVLTVLGLIQSATAAVTFTQTGMNVTVTGTGSEILNTGTLVEANHVGNALDTVMQSAGTVTLDNGLAFGNSITSLVSGWSPFHSTSSDAHNRAPLVINSAFDVLTSSYIWIAYGGSVSNLTINSLTVGQDYRLQLVSVAPAGGSGLTTVSVEGDTTSWSGTNSLLTATWTATDTTANIILSRVGGEIEFNAYALHAVPEPSALLLGSVGVFTLLRRRRSA